MFNISPHHYHLICTYSKALEMSFCCYVRNFIHVFWVKIKFIKSNQIKNLEMSHQPTAQFREYSYNWWCVRVCQSGIRGEFIWNWQSLKNECDWFLVSWSICLGFFGVRNKPYLMVGWRTEFFSDNCAWSEGGLNLNYVKCGLGCIVLRSKSFFIDLLF